MGLFSPQFGQGEKISATATSSRVQLAGGGNCVVVDNLGTSKVFIKLGDSSVTATVDVDLCLQAAGSIALCVPSLSIGQYLAAVCDSGETATVYAITGYYQGLG